MGNNPSLTSDGNFLEPPLATSPGVDEHDQSELGTIDSDMLQVLSSTMSTSDSTIEPIPSPTPPANDNQLELEANCPNNSKCLVDPEAKLFEGPTESGGMLFDSTENINVLESSFDSSNSSIINICDQSSESIPEVIEHSSTSSEALLLGCIDQLQVMLKAVSFEHGNTQTISDQILKGLNDLHQTIGVFANLGTNATANTEKSSEILHSDSAFHICEGRTVLSNMGSTAGKDVDSPSEIGLHSAVVCTGALDTSSSTPVNNLSTFVQERSQPTDGDIVQLKSKEAENEGMSVAEKVSVDPFLLKSLSALQNSTGVNSLLTDVERCTGTFRPIHTRTQHTCEGNKQSKCTSKEQIPIVGLNANDSQCKEKTNLKLLSVSCPIGLDSIIRHENSAATLGKAVIRNALAFEKYSVLFRQALNDDVVTASIGRALCKNALLFESLTTLANVDQQCQFQQQQQQQQAAVGPTVNISKVGLGKQNRALFTSTQSSGNGNKENENPTVEHLFKQTASKRKLGTLEEETRRTKCLLLSHKSTVEKRPSHTSHAWTSDHVAKPVRKAKNYNPNNDGSLHAGPSKPKNAMNKETLREIMINGPRKETKQERLFQNTDNVLDFDRPTLINKETKEERWTVIDKINDLMLEFEDSDDEHTISLLDLPPSLRTDLQSPQTSTTENKESTLTVETNYMLKGESIECGPSSKQMDSLSGIYYFTNQYIFCSICNINMFNHLRVLDHINGTVHETNLMNSRKTVAPIISVGAMLQSIWDQIDISLGRKLFCKLVKFENDTLECILCDVQVSGCLNVITHVSGKEHQANVLDKIFSTADNLNISKQRTPMAEQRKIFWPEGLSLSSSDTSLSDSEGSIAEWLPICSPLRTITARHDLAGIYYFAKNYVFCSICNINMFNSSIVLGHLHAKSHQANILLQKQIQSNQALDNETSLKRIWNQIERTLGGTLFRTVLCVDKNANFFCDLCNMQIIIPGHLNILDHVSGKKHNKEFLKRILLPSCK